MRMADWTRLDFLYCAGTAGLEPVTYCVTGSRSNQLSYAPIIIFSVAGVGLEPTNLRFMIPAL